MLIAADKHAGLTILYNTSNTRQKISIRNHYVPSAVGDVVLGCFVLVYRLSVKGWPKTYLGSFTSMHLEAVKLMFYSKQTKTEDPGWVLRAPVWTLTLDWAWTLYMHVPDELPRREIVITKTAFLAHTLYTHTHSTSSQLNKLNQLSYLRFQTFEKRLIPTPSTLVERAVYNTHSTRLFSFTRYSSPEFLFRFLGLKFSWKLHSEMLIKIAWWLTGIAAESLLGWLTSDLQICAGGWKCQSRSARSSVKSRERGFQHSHPIFLVAFRFSSCICKRAPMKWLVRTARVECPVE